MSSRRSTSADGPLLQTLLDAAGKYVPPIGSERLIPKRGFVLCHHGERQPLAALFPTAYAYEVAQRLWREGERSMQQLIDQLRTEDDFIPWVLDWITRRLA